MKEEHMSNVSMDEGGVETIMAQSHLWVNSSSKKKQEKSKRKKKHQRKSMNVTPISSSFKKRATSIRSSQIKSQPSKYPSFLETISTISSRIDLPKIRDRLTEVNEIVNQVGGVIEQINQWGRPVQRNFPYPPNQHTFNSPPHETGSAFRRGSIR